MEITKADWKLFQERIGDWQEQYMEKLVKEYIELLTSPGYASDHFWELEKRIKQDMKHPGVNLELNKGEAIWNIAILIKNHVITIDDLDGFSEALIKDVKNIVNR